MTELLKLAFQTVPKPGTQRYNEALDRFRGGSRKHKPLPGEFGLPGLKAEPAHRTADKVDYIHPHQQSGVDFIVQHNGQGILAHATGSGKTITAVKAGDRLMELGKAHKWVVVTPAGLRTNFLVEGLHRASDHKGSILAGSGETGPGIYHWSTPDPDSKYHVVSYEIFREHPEEIIKATGADGLILDEFHRVKDPDRSTFKRLSDVRPLVRNVIGLTGSVISTHPSNILQPIDAVTGGQHSLGTKEQFENKYLQRAPAPRVKRKPTVLSKPSTWANWLLPPPRSKVKRNTEFTGWKNTDELKHQLSQHIHYVGPEIVAEKMPEKYVDTMRVEMSPMQEVAYRAALRELPAPLLRKVQQGQPLLEGEQGEVFNRLIKARQVSNSLAAMTGLTPHEAAPATPKLQKMLDDIEDHLHQTPDGGAIIYTNLVHGGSDLIRAGLEQRGIPHGLFLGKGNEGVTEESRQQDVQDFKSGKKKVIVVSGAGNEGVSLPNATFHAAYDGHFNPEKIMQAEARGWRLGGQSHRPQEKRRVHVRRYLTVWPESRTLLGKVTAYFKNQEQSDSVDEWIYRTADRRHNINAQLHDILRGDEPAQHSLFPEERGLNANPAVQQTVQAPKLDPNYKPPVGAPAPAVDLRNPAPEPKSWWQSWKGASLDGVLDLPNYDLEGKLASLSDLVGLNGMEPHASEEYSAGMPAPAEGLAADKPKEKPWMIPPIIVGGFEPAYRDPRVDDSAAAARELLPWMNKEPGLKAAADGTPEPQLGDTVRVRLEDRTKHDDFSIVPMGDIPGTLNAADGDPWDAIPIDVPLHKVRGIVTGEIIGKIEDRKGNHKLVVKSEPGPLTKRQKQNLQAYQAARQVWAGKMQMKVPGVKDVRTKLGQLFFARARDGMLKEASSGEGEVLSVVVNTGVPHEKTARGDKLGPIVRVGHDDHILDIKRQLRDRFDGLEEPRGEPHVTLLYAHGLKDARHPVLLSKVTKHLEQKKMSFRFTRLGTFGVHNEGGKGVIYLAAEGKDLHDTHRDLRGAALEHGAKFTHPTYRPHMTLFYRDRPFTAAEKADIAKIKVTPTHLDRDRSHIDVTVKQGQGWKKLAQDDLEVPDLAAVLWMAKAALTPAEAPEEPPPAREIPLRTAWVDLPAGLSYSKAASLAEEIEESLRAMPEVTTARITLSKGAGVSVSCSFRELEHHAAARAILVEALAPVLQKHSGVTVMEDDTPKPKRWVEPKYRRPACQVPNSMEHTRTFVEYAGGPSGQEPPPPNHPD